MDIATALLLILLAGGYLLPAPSIGMAAYSYFRRDKAASTVQWRNMLTRFVLGACAALTVFWGYAIFKQLHDAYSYILPSARFGRWSSLGLAILALPTLGRVRIYLILCALGLLLFFSCSVGELP